MAAAFHEVFPAFGVDEDRKPPGMIVPLHGSNIVALEGGPDLKVVPEKDFVRVVKLDSASVQKYTLLANQQKLMTREKRPLGTDTIYFEVYGKNLGRRDGTILKAIDPKTPKKEGPSLKVVVVGNKTINIAIRPVKVRDEKGNWASHSSKQFDPDLLRDQMNAIWTSQANVVFDLISSDPFLIEEVKLAEHLKRTGVSREAFLKDIHIQAFAPLFKVPKDFKDPKDHKSRKVDLTFYMVKSILDLNLAHPHERGTYPAGATIRDDRFTLVCDQIELDLVRQSRQLDTIPGITLAHEAGHFMGVDGHDTTAGNAMLMANGGPIVGLGKVPFDQVIQFFNT